MVVIRCWLEAVDNLGWQNVCVMPLMSVAEYDESPTIQRLAFALDQNPNTHLIQRSVLTRLGFLETVHNNTPVYTHAIETMGQTFRTHAMMRPG